MYAHGIYAGEDFPQELWFRDNNVQGKYYIVLVIIGSRMVVSKQTFPLVTFPTPHQHLCFGPLHSAGAHPAVCEL